jgi:hypothetical protein
LEGRRNVRLFFVDWTFSAPILRPGGLSDTFELLSGFHGPVYTHQRVTIRPEVPILFVGMDPYPSKRGGIPIERLILPLNPEMKEIARFENPPTPGISRPDAIVIYRLR